MVKKVLSIAAAAAIAVTGASAFDVFDDGWNPGRQLPYTYNNAVPRTATTAPSLDAVGSINVMQAMTGDALVFPVYYVGNGWETHLRVINTSSTNAVVAKVVFFAGNDSRELRDFNIYLSANDVWTGTVKIDTDGVARLISTDESSPLPGGGMASASNPMKTEPIDVPVGYVAVIGLAMAVDSNIPTHDYKGAGAAGLAALAGSNALDMKDARAHGDHSGLRKAYNAVATRVRAIGQPIVFNNGVITSGTRVPNVDLASAVTTPTNVGGDNKGDYFFAGVRNVLAGDVRITDNVNGKDMVMPAITIQNETDDTGPRCQALLVAEGEKAHLADRALTGADAVAGSTPNFNAVRSEYDYARLAGDATAFGERNVWMMYGDTTSYVNNQLIVTSPYKRVLIEASAQTLNPAANPQPLLDNGNCIIAVNPPTVGTNVLATVYSGVKSANAQIVDWGYFTALAFVYDESENQAQASQFSPANTPAINFHYEVSTTEGNPAPTDNLSYYLSQASGFDKGYVLMRYIANGTPITNPAIATQWLATEAAGKVITNWTIPTQQ